ncbi:MAG: PilN domain-containing protein [Humidesulfovibrio sp.]|uniref:PilN domain-containing protein n=1 Tax=Humidesulfovibrio sp. TaxID=2910988 RepID=UPI0027325C37|nr:PilN domain-containing protein [Humidesulfovibrio sp.]MDP2849180.1 PilN domain-containing protein [Humidesulfovibrio sp.]
MSNNADSQPQGLPEAEHHRYGRILLAVTIAGLLFLAGQTARWWQEHRHAQRLREAVHQVYQRALAADPGRSPYGRLQFELGKLKAQSAQRLDMVELLAALSRRAPAGVRITSITMATASGMVSGLAATPEDLRRYQAALAAEAYFTLSVRKVETYASPLRFELDVKARDRSAPPRGDDQ